MDYLNGPIDWDIAAWYDEMPLWSAPFGMLLLEHLPMEPGMRVLDVGCGTGFPLLELAQRLGQSCTVVGLDPWHEAVERARQKAKAWSISNLEIIDGDALAMPFEDGSFDLIVSNLGINNLSKPESALAECCRVLKSRGRIALTTNPCGHMSLFYNIYKATLEEMGETRCLELLDQHVQHRKTVNEIDSLLASAGFAVQRVEQRDLVMKFLNGSALLCHSFVRLAFLDGWREVARGGPEKEIFSCLERNLNRWAEVNQGLKLVVPMAYIEAKMTR